MATQEQFRDYGKLVVERMSLLKTVVQAKRKHREAVQAVRDIDAKMHAIETSHSKIPPTRMAVGEQRAEEHRTEKPPEAEDRPQEDPTLPDGDEQLPIAERVSTSLHRGQADTTTPMAARPGLCAYTGPRREPIRSHDHIEANGQEPKLSSDYTMIVWLDGGWFEIWCHICGANASSCVTSPDHLQGIAGLTTHLAAMHGGFNVANSVAKNWTRADALATCGKYFLGKEDLRALCRWELTTNKVTASGRPVPDVKKRHNAPLPPLPDVPSQVLSSSTMRATTPILGKRQRLENDTGRDGEDEADNMNIASKSSMGWATAAVRTSSEKIQYYDGSEDDF